MGCSQWERRWEGREEIHQGRRAIRPQGSKAQVSQGLATVPAQCLDFLDGGGGMSMSQQRPPPPENNTRKELMSKFNRFQIEIRQIPYLATQNQSLYLN